MGRGKERPSEPGTGTSASVRVSCSLQLKFSVLIKRISTSSTDFYLLTGSIGLGITRDFYCYKNK